MSAALDDITCAARRLAEDSQLGMVRNAADILADLVALLPILDVVAAGTRDEGRVDRYAKMICWAAGYDPDIVPAISISEIAGRYSFVGTRMWHRYIDQARAAIALADADAKARMEAGWQAYEEARRVFGNSTAQIAMIDLDDPEEARFLDLTKAESERCRTALDAAVRRLVT